MDYFTSFISGGFSLPYTVGEKHGECWGAWEHFRATANADKKPVSLFKLVVNKTDTMAVDSARNGVKRLRTTKHPRILSFEWAGEQEAGNKITVYLVTEPVTPLPTLMDEIELSGKQRSVYLSLGLRQVAEALAFLGQCSLVHGNVCRATILVTSDLDWRLGFFDVSTDHASLGSSILMRYGHAVPGVYRPGELDKGQFDGPPNAVDSWGLGCLVREVFGCMTLQGKDQLRDTASLPQEMLSDYKNLLHSVPTKRLSPSTLLENPFLKNDLVDTMNFLEDLSIKDPSEKNKFFRNLPNLVPSFPEVVCTRKLLPLISSALSYGGAPAIALGCLLQIGKMLPDDEFKARIVPILSALFSSSDPAIRSTLLENIPQFASLLTEQVVESNIFPQLAKGLSAGNAQLREQTLKAMLPLAPKLSARSLNTVLLKQLDKLQVDEEPSIRANTTVLLGNIAPNLGPAACKRVLLNAFARALRDVYPPSRAAALRALVATAPYHAPQAVAARVVPSISPLMLDPQPDVRAAANQALDFFCRALKAASTEVATGVDLSKAPAELIPEAETTSKTNTMTSLISWAISSTSSAAGGPVKATPSPATGGSGLPPGPAPGIDTSKAAGKLPGVRVRDDRESQSYGAAQPSGRADFKPSSGAAGVFAAQQSSGTAFGGGAVDSGWGDDANDGDGDGWGDLGILDDDFDDALTSGSKRDTNGGGSSAYGTPVTTFSGSSRRGSTDIASLDVKVSEGDSWGGAGSGWGDTSPAVPAAPAPAPRKPAKAKGKLKLGVKKAADAKAD